MNNIKPNIVDEHLGLVHSCAKRFKGRGIEYDDLFQSGCVGLIKASENFNETLGYKFSTYAVPVILGEIKQLFRKDGSIKVSRKLKDLSIKVKKVCEELEHTTGKEPTLIMISEKLGIDTESVAQAMNSSTTPISLNEIDEKFGSSLEISTGAEEEKIVELLSLKKSLDNLEEQDKMLILLRFYKDYTQTQTAKFLKMTQVQISRKEKAILKKLKQNLLL